MIILFNEYTMNKAAILGNSLQVIEHYGRFYVGKEYNGKFKVFLNTASFSYACTYASMM